MMAAPQCYLILKWRAYIAIYTMCVICTCIMLLLHLISPIVLLHIHVVLVKAYWCMCGFPNPRCWMYCMHAPAHLKNMYPVPCSTFFTMWCDVLTWCIALVYCTDVGFMVLPYYPNLTCYGNASYQRRKSHIRLSCMQKHMPIGVDLSM